MMRGVLAALAIGTFITGWASDKVEAQQKVLFQPQNGSVTQSGGPLRGLQGRSIIKDFPSTSVKFLSNSLGSNKPKKPSPSSGIQSIASFLGFTKRIEFGGLSGFAVRYRLNK
jgi:hypothetical protein